MPEPARVFEHGTLAVGEQGLSPRHFDALVRYNDRHGCTLFKVGHQRLHFGSFVGVLQVGTLTIEILPKAEKGSSADKRKWQRALLQMLRQSGMVEVEAGPEANLRLRRSPLIDIYLDSFLSEVECLTHAGLTKKYRLTEGNLYKLKGRILFRQQISHNLLHRERMFTAHQTYDADNVFNRILKCALEIVERLAVSTSIPARASALGLSFEQVSDVRVTPGMFERLRFDRSTQRYRKAVQLARLIILNYAPDLCGGPENILAILFDMNRLFERFILVHLRRAQSQMGDPKMQVKAQASARFWASKTIRPDILINLKRGSRQERLILDTKWKIPGGDYPSDEDLKQMYAYNLHFGAHHSLLVYPRADAAQSELHNAYAESAALPSGHRHTCATHFVDLFDAEGKLSSDIGRRLLQRILSETEQ
jgi:5-methylcytosine-specific restriction enzyme subunit McrC